MITATKLKLKEIMFNVCKYCDNNSCKTVVLFAGDAVGRDQTTDRIVDLFHLHSVQYCIVYYCTL